MTAPTPDDLLSTAIEALLPVICPNPKEYRRYRRTAQRQAGAVLGAVRSDFERAVRERVALDIESEAEREKDLPPRRPGGADYWEGVTLGKHRAADIARHGLRPERTT